MDDATVLKQVNDAAVLKWAAKIMAEQQARRTAELHRLWSTYARSRNKTPHDLGKPKKLLPEEALLLVAIERNKYQVTAEQPNGTRWHGDATCRFHVRGMAMSIGALSRLDLLWALWAVVSGQTTEHGEWGSLPAEHIRLEEHHLQGSVVQRDLRELRRTLREQEQAERDGVAEPEENVANAT